MPKGDYSASTTYAMLDIVNHSGASWVCKQACTGQTPSDSNTAYWQRLGIAVDLANYLPLVNSATMEVKTAQAATLTLNNTNPTHGVNYVQYKSTVGDMGYLGFSAINNPAFMSTGGVVSDLLHTGNKPTGTYTGNGSATARTVKVGGVGNCIMVRRVSSEDFAIVTESGYIGRKGGVVVTGSDAYWTRDGGGNLYMATTSELFNASGGSYYYELL